MTTALYRNSVSVVVGNVVMRFGDLVVVVLAARLLTVSDFAVFVLSLSFYSLFRLVGDGGLQIFLVREMAQNRGHAPRYFRDAMLFQALWSSVVAVLYVGTVLVLNYPPNTALGLFVILFALLPDGLVLPALCVIQAYERMEYLAAVNTVTTVLRVVLSIASILLGFGLIGVLACTVFSRIVGFVSAQWFARRLMVTPAVGSSWSALPQLARSVLPFIGIAILAAVFQRADVLILSRLADDHAVATLGLGMRLIEPGLLVAGSIGLAIYPAIASAFKRDGDELSSLYSASLRGVMLAGMVVVCLGDGLIPPLVAMMFPPDYGGVVPVAQLFLWYLLLFAIDQVAGRVLLSVGRQDLNLRIIMFGAPLVVVLHFLLIPRWGAVGAAVADCAATAVILALDVLLVDREVPQARLERVFGLPLLATFAGWGIGRLVSPLGWAIQSLIVAMALIPLAWWSQLIKPQDLALVRSLLNRPAGSSSNVSL